MLILLAYDLTNEGAVLDVLQTALNLLRLILF